MENLSLILLAMTATCTGGITMCLVRKKDPSPHFVAALFFLIVAIAVVLAIMATQHGTRIYW